MDYIGKLIISNDYRGPNKELINIIILVSKQYLYSAKCKQEKLEFPQFTAKLNYWYNIEKIMAQMSHKVKQFNKKWKIYENVM